MGYKKTEQEQDTIFEVVPEEMPEGTGLVTTAQGCYKVVGYVFLFLVFAAIATVVTLPFGKLAGLLSWVVLGIILWRWIKRRRKAQPQQSPATADRVPSRFIVNPQGITLKQQFYKVADIHRIVKKNVVEEAMEGRVIFSGSHAHNAGVQMGMAYNKKLAAVSYVVQFESGGLPYVLAGGLTDAAAFAILSDVSRILGMK